MRFSVLLPTRNGGEYLHDAITSVLDQPYRDMELVVSDNASSPETFEVISRFMGDSRLKYIRLEETVSVTENWNHALRASQGDYLVMIGDDDCLLPHFFDRLDAAIDRHQQPDCLTYNGTTFVFPGSLAGQPDAFFVDRHFAFGPEYVADAPITREFRLTLVKQMFEFKVRFPLNMQLTLFSRRAAAAVRGGVFRAPFPDHYALNSLLLVAKTFVYIPDRLVAVGISPKSFGHYYYGGEQRAGAQYLGLTSSTADQLPGSELLNCMRDWLLLLQREYPDYLGDTRIGQWSYAGRQVYHWMRDFEFGLLDVRELTRRARLLSWNERASFLLPLFAYRSALRMLRTIGVRHTDRFHDMWPALRPLPAVRSMHEFVDWAASHHLT